MKLFPQNPAVPINKVDLTDFGLTNTFLYIKREDLIHPTISGNKYRKLKYNIQSARNLKKDTLLTFGGAFSNHIAAVAAVGKEFNFKTIGVIRGEELEEKISQNPTLSFSKACGMEFHFVSRDEYRLKDEAEFIDQLKIKFGDFYLIPEGGTNGLAVKGCEEIIEESAEGFDIICVPVGTGGTLAGLVKASSDRQIDRKSTRLNSSHVRISYAVFCLKKKNITSICRCCIV